MSLMKEKFNPTEEQIRRSVEELSQNGIVFENNATFIHNRAENYASALTSCGYGGDLVSIGIEIKEQGFMYAVFDSDKMDYSEAKKKTINHFIKK